MGAHLSCKGPSDQASREGMRGGGRREEYPGREGRWTNPPPFHVCLKKLNTMIYPRSHHHHSLTTYPGPGRARRPVPPSLSRFRSASFSRSRQGKGSGGEGDYRRLDGSRRARLGAPPPPAPRFPMLVRAHFYCYSCSDALFLPFSAHGGTIAPLFSAIPNARVSRCISEITQVPARGCPSTTRGRHEKVKGRFVCLDRAVTTSHRPPPNSTSRRASRPTPFSNVDINFAQPKGSDGAQHTVRQWAEGNKLRHMGPIC
ncbi:uncharacterized protein LY79DRAFT_152169 [Colletotrichum navitas]|uniref:Uncharacterized protein n=1 Tax=Colletotrichum navitas TaxID=681940 RepID=A0AAD8VB07_9PEZI|nr:uncharacterized protein LY79DRAFT_152169 [Colletotrichum navitas]KAK1599809.1 hypothetical protein LY79DRAFT_152169 [Colletotrichum navitas]